VCCLLRAGNAPTQQGALPLLKRIVGRLQERFPKTRILVRLDGGFAAPELFEWLDEVGVGYVVAMAKNAVLERLAELDMIVARVLSEHSGRTEYVYGEARYAAQTWERERRVIYKAEVVRQPGNEPKDNPRFVVTNLTRTPRRLYERIYCQRGEPENRIKELELGLQIGRTSCSRFWANQTARPAHRRRLCAHAGSSSQGGAHHLGAGPRVDAARTTDQARRSRRHLGAADRAPSSRLVSVPRGLASRRGRVRRRDRLILELGSTQSRSGRQAKPCAKAGMH